MCRFTHMCTDINVNCHTHVYRDTHYVLVSLWTKWILIGEQIFRGLCLYSVRLIRLDCIDHSLDLKKQVSFIIWSWYHSIMIYSPNRIYLTRVYNERTTLCVNRYPIYCIKSLCSGCEHSPDQGIVATLIQLSCLVWC